MRQVPDSENQALVRQSFFRYQSIGTRVSARFSLPIAENQGVVGSNPTLGTLAIDPPEKVGLLRLYPTGGAKTGCFWAPCPTFAKQVPDIRARCFPTQFLVALQDLAGYLLDLGAWYNTGLYCHHRLSNASFGNKRKALSTPAASRSASSAVQCRIG
jgi:hypothetical protein